MISALPNQRRNIDWQSIWNRSIVFLFIVTYFFDGVSRYKHAISYAIYITGLVYIVKQRKKIFSIFKNNLFLSLTIFCIAIIYAIAISVEPSLSLKRALNTVFEKMLLVSVMIAVVLHKEDNSKIATMLIAALITTLVILTGTEIHQYIEEYKIGIMPFTKAEHRRISDTLIFIFPAILTLWVIPSKKYKILFFVLAAIFAILMLGTLQRGTWLSLAVPALIWALIKREWKLPLIALVVIGFGLFAVHQKDPQQVKTLFYKLQQTDSSGRYENGTQGAALDLILENPIKGYGFGNDLYHHVYNERSPSYPDWRFKKSIGPHNLTLSIWFAGGIIGLASLYYLLASALVSSIKGYRESNGPAQDAFLILTLILIGDFVVRGAFETVRIENIAVIIGILLALHAKKYYINN
ncbi:O-protein polymerase [Hafnia alvei FB1]|uniref:O-protein polymerase n=1 Tax=Hafnia alvei FB1 TaxID=1453496 RepID=A0A097QXF7_HAFAL|nr:O-antigen ligase RfaL [Hafnia alvei]AIU71160.1 O-protein polymerase [Hafnia alvei FB1]TBL62755.1 O-antigen ligase RfaL [Hafnia alvei]